MLNLLKIEVSGFKMLDDKFKLDLMSKTRVYQEDKEKELFELDKGLYVFRTLAFVGSNSSGKSSVLSLLLKVLMFLQTGRWEYLKREFNKDEITIKTLFYLDGYLYNYSFSVGKIDDANLSPMNKYSPILKEKLKK